MRNRTIHLSLQSKSTEIGAALDGWHPWLKSVFGGLLEEVLQLRFDVSLAELAVGRILPGSCRAKERRTNCGGVENVLVRVEFPPLALPAMALHRGSNDWCAEWLDCPVALHFKGLSRPVVALNVPFVDCLNRGSDWREVALVAGEDAAALLRLLDGMLQTGPMLKTMGGETVRVRPLSWDDLVLDGATMKLVRNDFLQFLERKQWFQDRLLPFRRGYLLHGPPGNGKSSVIRAMLSSSGMCGFTINPFHPFYDENMLSALFAEAAESAPALVVLEDLDRCYPTSDKDEKLACTMPLQQLLNQLDGVGTQDGIVVVATANQPAILDPAILRRPGRFDRVVGLQNPSAALRERYFRQVDPSLGLGDVSECCRITDGFSFAQLRESYVLADQIALEDGRPIDGEALASAARMLIELNSSADKRWGTQAGFREG